MRYLLDTNIFIYAANDKELLSRDVLALLDDYDNTFYISAESIKELVHLHKTKGVCAKQWKTAKQMIQDIEKNYNITILPIKKEHLLTYAGLETPDWHNDPSDHIIIAQSMTEHIPLISSDLKFPYYEPQGLDLIFNKKPKQHC
ncbi:MAG: type II toxin-antitoxin system VapC family toxin [Paludibacteraceae bacterium]